MLVLVSLTGCDPSRNAFAEELPSILLWNFWIFKVNWFTINLELTNSRLHQPIDERFHFNLSAFVLLLILMAISSNFETILLLLQCTMLLEHINEPIRISLADFICNLFEFDHVVAFFHSAKVSIRLSSLSFLSDFVSFSIKLDK